jgi:hypothetical protein
LDGERCHLWFLGASFSFRTNVSHTTGGPDAECDVHRFLASPGLFGSRAVLAPPIVQAAAAVLADVATFDSAGVTDKEGSA